MKKLLVFILIILISISIISALCEEGQIDINKALKEELDNLYGIGPVKAEEIINSRPFGSVDDLINVYGIGEITLEKIKEQGLACIGGETEESDEKEVEEKDEEEIKEEEPEPIYNKEMGREENKKEIIELEVIRLNAKTIKSEDDKENSNKNNYATYGFVVFCVLIGFLFMLKKKRFNKNEFEE